MTEGAGLRRYSVCLIAPLAALLACSPFAHFETDRIEDLQEAATLPPPERAATLRDRVLRDGLDEHVTTVYAGMPEALAAAEKMRSLLADDYLELGKALEAAGDHDGAIRAYEDAVAQAKAPDGSRVGLAALRGEQAAWRAQGDVARSEAARLLADSATAADRPAALAQGGAALGDAPELALVKKTAVSVDGSRALRAMTRGASDASIEAMLAAANTPAPAATPPSQPPAPAEKAPAPPATDVAGRLKRLEELKQQNLVTDDEYQRERARILKEGL